MSTGEDESLPGLNGRLRPRKSTITTPSPHKSTRKSEGKLAEDRPKRTGTPSKASPSKQDDLTAKPDLTPAFVFLCPYCDRKFTSKQTASKHARRIHLFTSKQDHFIKCLHCNHSEAESNDIIKHMVDNHPNQYFACLDCYTRFSATTELAEHKHIVCEKKKPSYRSKLRQKTGRTKKNTKRSNNAHNKSDIQNENTECTDEHRFNGIVISCELKPSQTHDAADIEDNLTTNLILPPTKTLGKSVMEKNAVIVLDDIQWNKRMPPNFSFHSTDADQILSRLGVVHRSPRVGESTKKEWMIMDESIQKFERCFDTNFYSKVAKNVQENMTKFLDGTFNFNPNRENTIKTRKSKTGVVINTAEGFPILLAYEQYSRNLFDGYMPRTLAPRHKWKWDNAETDKNVLMHIDQSKRDSHVNNCIITLVSSLDIWTQLKMRRKFEDIFKITPTAKKTEKQNIIGRELKEILESRDIPSNSTQIVKYQSSEAGVSHSSELPAHLGLKPAMPTCELKPAVLSGEWVRPRCYVCCACGEQTNDARTLSSHISTQHPNAQVQHYEIVGETLLSADILKHLYVPPSQMSNRTRPPRGFRDCTKCKKSITLEDLHQHMLDCAGDTPAVRRKCRYRPFGVRKRRSRMPDNTIRKKMRKDIRSRHRQKCHLRTRPKIRTEVGDAETIRKMIADLPAKRNRIPLTIPRPRRNILTAKKAIKHRSSEDIKTAKVRTAKKITRLKKAEALKKQAEVDNLSNLDEDDQPLKLSYKLEDITKTNNEIVSSGKGNKANKDIKDQDLSVHQNLSKCSLNTQFSINNDHQKVDVYGAGPSNVRKHSNRSNSNNHDSNNRRPTSEKKNGNEENDITPAAPDLPFKQCIGSSTSRAESLDRNLHINEPHYISVQDTNQVPHLISDDHQTFESETVAKKFDKPPLWKDFSETGASSRDKSKLLKNKKGLEHCIAMLRTKKGLPESSETNKPSNLKLPKPTRSPTRSVSLDQSGLDRAQASSKIYFEAKPQTNCGDGLLSTANIHSRKSSVDSHQSISPNIKQDESTIKDFSPRRKSLSQNDNEITATMAGNTPLEFTHWVPALPIAGATYSDFSIMRRNSYDPTLASGHPRYQNTTNTASAMNVADIQNIMHSAHAQNVMRNAEGNISWHYPPQYYRQDFYNQYARGNLTPESGLGVQYPPIHHGQIDTSFKIAPTPGRRRDSNKKDLNKEPQKGRKPKTSPGKNNLVSSSYYQDAAKQIRASSEDLNAHLASSCYSAESSSSEFRVRRDSHKRSMDSLESEVNFPLSREDGSSGKMPRKSPRPYYPENASGLLNLRRQSMELGDIHPKVGSNDTNVLQVHHGLYDRDPLNVSPRSRSESRTTTPDETYTRRYYDEKARVEIFNELHSRNMAKVLTMRHDLHGNSEAIYRNDQLTKHLMNHDKQLQDAMAAQIQNVEYYNKIQNKPSVRKPSIDGAQQMSCNYELDTCTQDPVQDNELRKQGNKQRSRDQVVTATNVYNLNVPTDECKSQKSPIRDNQSIKKKIISPNDLISFGNLNLPKSLQITAHHSPSGVYSPPDLRKNRKNSSSSESNEQRQYSENSRIEDSSSIISHPVSIHRSDLVYPTMSTGELNLSISANNSAFQPVVPNETVAEIPLDLSRKDYNAATVRVTAPCIPDITIEKHTDDPAVSLRSLYNDQISNLPPKNLDTKDGILIERENATDLTQSVQTIKEIRQSEKPDIFQFKKPYAPHDFPANEESEPCIVLAPETEPKKQFQVISITNPSDNYSINESETWHENQGNLQKTKNIDFERNYHTVQLHSHDEKINSVQAVVSTDNFIVQPQDAIFDFRTSPISEANSKIEEVGLKTANINYLEGNLPQVQIVGSGIKYGIEKCTSDITPLNLINTMNVKETKTVIIESDNEENHEIVQKPIITNQYEALNKMELSKPVLAKTNLMEIVSEVINVENKTTTDENKGLDPVTFANLEELMVINEAQSNESKKDSMSSDTDNLKSELGLKIIHQYIAGVLEQMNEVQIKRMLGISPTLMAKVKAATVNETIASSPTRESTTINASDNLPVTIFPSSIIPKKRYSPSQPFVRLSSCDSGSASPELRTSINVPNGVQLTPVKHHSANNKINTYRNNYLETCNTDMENVSGFTFNDSKLAQRPDNDNGDNEINVVDDVPEPDSTSNTNNDLQISPVNTPPTVFAQDLDLKAPMKRKHTHEQTASLRAVRIKTPSSMKSGEDDKYLGTVINKSLHTKADENDVRAFQSNITPCAILIKRDPKYVQSELYPPTQMNYSGTLSSQDSTQNNAMSEDQMNENSNCRVVQENDVNTNKCIERVQECLSNADSFDSENILLNAPISTLNIKTSQEVNMTTPCVALQEAYETNRPEEQLKVDVQDLDVFIDPTKAVNSPGDKSNDESLKQIQIPSPVLNTPRPPENVLITELNSTSIILPPESLPLKSLSPKSKKSDGDDSEDEVSLADILKKRNINKALTNEIDTSTGKICLIENNGRQNVDEKLTANFKNELSKTNTENLSSVSHEEERNLAIESYNKFINDEIKQESTVSILTKPSSINCNIGIDFDHSNVTHDSEISNDNEIQYNIENSQNYALRNEIEDTTIISICKFKSDLSPDLNIDSNQTCFKSVDQVIERRSTANEGKSKETLIKSKLNSDKNFTSNDTSQIVDVDSINKSNLITTRQEEDTSFIEDGTKPDMPYMLTENVKKSNDTPSRIPDVGLDSGLLLFSEVSEKNLVPLRRSRRVKSLYVDSSHGDDYDYNDILDDVDKSKKIPLTMKRLILSRVEKDRNDYKSSIVGLNIHDREIECDNIVLVNKGEAEKSCSKKAKPIKRKQSSHSKQKTKMWKSSHKHKYNDDDSTDEKKTEKGLVINELPHAKNKIKSQEIRNEDVKICPVPENTSDMIEHSPQMNGDRGKEENSSHSSKKLETTTVLTGKRKTKAVLPKSKKVKYTKTKSYSDFESEDEKDLTEIKQKQNEKISDSLTLPGKNKDDAYRLSTERNKDSDLKMTGYPNTATETRTTCYSRSISNKKQLSSFVSKKESINYDPYDIDFDDMIETTGPIFKRKGKNNTSKIHSDNALKVKTVEAPDKTLKKNNDKRSSNINLQNDNSDTDSDSSKSDVPLQKYVDEKVSEFCHKNKNYNNNYSKYEEEDKFDESDLIQDNDATKQTSEDTSDNINNYEDDSNSTCNSNRSGSRLSSLNQKPTQQGKNGDTSCELVSSTDQNLNMNNNNAAAHTRTKHNKVKKNRRTLAAFNVVDTTIQEVDQQQQLLSDKFMESFGFFSEKIPRKSNLLATKKISETFHNMTSNESDDSLIGCKKIKPTRKSSQEYRKTLEESSELNISEDATSFTSAGNEIDPSSPPRNDIDDNSVSDDQHDLSKSDDEINALQSFIECEEHLRKEMTTSPAVDTDANAEQHCVDIEPPITETIEANIQEEKSLDNLEDSEAKCAETVKKTTKNTTTKQLNKKHMVKSKMYPDIEEIDLLEDKFDKIKRKRRSLAVAAKQMQTAESSASSKTRKQPKRKKTVKNVKKKCQNPQVPTKGALKGFESIKISIPTQELNMPPSLSPPRQQKRRRKGTKCRKGTSESGSSCSEYEDKEKSFQDRDVYEFKDNEDTELLELRASTVMDRFRSIHHNTNKAKNKDKGKGEKEKHKEKGKKTEAKERHSLKEEKDRIKTHSPKKDNGKDLYNIQVEMNVEDKVASEESNSSETERRSSKDEDLQLAEKYCEIMNVTEGSAVVLDKQDIDMKSTRHDEIYPTQVTTCNREDEHTVDAVPGKSGFVPDRDDESDYESESSMAGGCIVYKSEEFNCLCQTYHDSEESDAEKTCGKSNCLNKNRNADKIAAIDNIFKNNAVRCDKTEIKEIEAPKPNLDQLFDSLLEPKIDELSGSGNKSVPETNNLFPVIDSWIEKNGTRNDGLINEISYVRDNVTLNSYESTKADKTLPMTCGDSYPVPEDNFDLSNISTRSGGLYMMVSTKSTQTGLETVGNETEAINKKRQTIADYDDFDINEKESDEWMVFQELLRPSSKGSQTELSTLLLNCNEHENCSDCEAEFIKYLEVILPTEICVLVTNRGSQTIILERQIHELDAKSFRNIKFDFRKKKFGIKTSDRSVQTELTKNKNLVDVDSDDDNALVEREACSATIEATDDGNAKIYTSSNRSQNDRADSLPEVASCSSIAELRSPSMKSDEGIGTSHDYSADTFDHTLDMGVAQQRARRKCTVGKQNVLAEHWSSESEAEAMPLRRNSVDSVVASKKRGRKKEHSGTGRRGNRHGAKKERRHGGRARASSEESEPTAGTSRRPPGPKIRAWARHNWSSDGEETDPQPQHGWIVGDSHKKLVTMLAHAKGRKRHSDDTRQLDE